MTTRPAYADLEIRILDQQREGYPVEITLNNEQEFPRGYLDPGFLPWVPSASPADDGERLFGRLLADARLRAAWAEARGQWPQRRVRLRIDAAAPALHAIPWELLREAGDGAAARDLAAAAASPFSRYLAGRWQPGSPILQRPIKILVVIANPQGLADYGLSPIDVGQEWASLQGATAGLEVELARFPPSLPPGITLPTRDGDTVTLTSPPTPCTLAGLERELLNGHHILHFIGHGAYDAREGKAVLYMADGSNRVALVSEAEFSAMLARQLADTNTAADDKLRLVFLASCQTATRSPADAFRGFAPALVAAGVPAVLAMQDLIPVVTARDFAAAFYRQLLDHGLVDLAVNEARSALLTAGLAGAAVPVLFMRLRSGELLGQRGRITSDREAMFWPFLLENIDRGQCTPFLGPRVNAGLLPGAETVAAKLADKYGYPLADRRNLARVAQFIALSDPDVLRRDYLRLLQRSLFTYLGLKPTEDERRRFRDAGLAQTAAAVNWAEQVLSVQEGEIHHLLAELGLPLYITTNADSFMVEALKHAGRRPRQAGLRWEQPEVGSPHYVLTPGPSPAQPVVLHIDGHDGDPEQERHLVLSEDDYLAHVVRLARDQESLLPMNVLRLLSVNSFLFLGYNLDDWEFRILLQGLIKPIAQTNRAKKLHVGVQLEVGPAPSAEKAMDYLQRYLGSFDIDIYWGTPQQFVSELHARWDDYLATEGNGW